MPNKVVTDKFEPLFLVQARRSLTQLRDDVTGIKSAMLATMDGFTLSAVPDYNSDKLAAVSSSMLAMGSALVFEAGLEGCRSLTIEANNGHIYVREFKTVDVTLIVMVLSTPGTALAHILHGVRKCQETLSSQTALRRVN